MLGKVTSGIHRGTTWNNLFVDTEPGYQGEVETRLKQQDMADREFDHEIFLPPTLSLVLESARVAQNERVAQLESQRAITEEMLRTLRKRVAELELEAKAADALVRISEAAQELIDEQRKHIAELEAHSAAKFVEEVQRRYWQELNTLHEYTDCEAYLALVEHFDSVQSEWNLTPHKEA